MKKREGWLVVGAAALLCAAAMVGIAWYSAHTQPPDFQVVQAEAQCGSSCSLVAVLRNDGGPGTGVVTLAVTGTDRRCTVAIPSTDRGATAQVSCPMNLARWMVGAEITATVER